MRRPLLIAILAALVLAAPSMDLGFVLDDYKLLADADGSMFHDRPLDFFTFAKPGSYLNGLIATGPYPWWTLPELKLSFLRPLPCADFYFDRVVFGDRAVAYHLHSFLWLVALILAAAALYRSVLSVSAAAFAVVLFAVDDAHALPTAWLANRNSLMAAVPAVLALVAHIRWRENGWKPGRWFAPLGLAIAFLSGESTLGIFAYFVSYELFTGRSLADRARALAPVLTVVVVWAVLYRSLGHGSSGSATYLDPGSTPWEYLAAAPGRLCALLGALTLAVTSDMWLAIPAWRPVLVVSGLFGATLMALAIARTWRKLQGNDRMALKWLGTGALMALVPVLSTFPTDRLLLTASLGAGGVISILLASVWNERLWLSRAMAVWLVLVNFAAPAVGWWGGAAVLKKWSRAGRDAVMEAPVEERTGRVVLVTVPDPAPAMYGTLFLREANRPEPERWWTLSFDSGAHRLKRVGDRALELEFVNGRMLDTVFEQLVRSERFPYRAQDVVNLAGAQITIARVDEGHPTLLKVDFDLPLEEHVFLAWNGAKFERLKIPDLNQTIDLPAQPSLMETAILK